MSGCTVRTLLGVYSLRSEFYRRAAISFCGGAKVRRREDQLEPTTRLPFEPRGIVLK